jgi:flotillin
VAGHLKHAEKTRREARGQADGILLKYQAEAEGVRLVLESKAAGYLSLVQGCNGDAKSAATLLMTEKIEQIVQLQVEAIKNIKIDKVTVWDSAGGGKDGTATSNFLSGLIKSLPPLHEVAAMAGIELPKYLGEISPGKDDAKSVQGKTPSGENF